MALDDLTRTGVGDRVAVAPATRGTMSPVDDVVPDIERGLGLLASVFVEPWNAGFGQVLPYANLVRAMMLGGIAALILVELAQQREPWTQRLRRWPTVLR